MKFKVTRNIKPNMFGKINGSVTLAGNKDCPYDIEWLLDEVITLGYSDIKDKMVLKQKRKYLMDSLINLEINRGYTIEDKKGQLAMLILRIPDDTTLADVLKDEIDGLFDY